MDLLLLYRVRNNFIELRKSHLSLKLRLRTVTCHMNPLIAQLDKFSREPSHCQGFLLQCSLYFTPQEGTINSSNIAQILSLLTGRVLSWVMVLWERDGEPITSYNCYVTMFLLCHKVYTPDGKEIGERLLCVRQRRKRVVEYVQQFCTLAAGRALNEPVLKAKV